MTIRQAYDTLGLDASSTTPDEVRLRFRDLIRSNHPDGKPTHEQARANETILVIVEACTLLRTKGFPLEMVCNGTVDASRLRYERPVAAEESAEPFAWVDELWRACVRSNLVCVVSPAFGVRFALDAWTMGWETMWGKRRAFK